MQRKEKSKRRKKLKKQKVKMYSGAFKTQSEFYHKLNSVANDCNFTNKDEIVKFLY